jgi:preprotein translocase subunit SecF
MKKIIHFSKFFLPASIISAIIVIVGVGGFITNRGFNLGVDFQAGLLQEIQFAPTAFRLTYNGPGNANVSLSRSSLDIVIIGIGAEELTHSFPFASFPSLGDLIRGLRGIEGLSASEVAPANTSSLLLIQSALSSPLLRADSPFVLHYLPPTAAPIRIEDVRSSLLSLGTVSVQALGVPSERHFMIRMDDRELESEGRGVPSERIINTLENTFGAGEVVVTRSDYVGESFARNLIELAGLLIILTLLLVGAYLSFRFKIHFAVGAIIGIVYDVIVIVAFVALTRMEFNTITIAAILTILGYSTNNTIVVFDRIRENRRIFPDDAFVDVLNRSLTATLNRTIITTLTTMLAVLSLFIFTTGSMKDFSLALLVGMASGVYTTLFIASGVVNFWETHKMKKEKRRMGLIPAKA